MKLTFVEQSPLGAKHCLIVIADGTVLVDVHMTDGGESVTVSETDFRGVVTSETLPKAANAVAIDLPLGTWDMLDLVSERDGQRYKPSGGALIADAGSAIRWNFILAGREMRKRAMLQRPMLNPLLADPVGPTLAPNVIQAPDFAPVAKAAAKSVIRFENPTHLPPSPAAKSAWQIRDEMMAKVKASKPRR